MAKREKLMSEKYPGSAGRYEPAMTFEEIGSALGIPKQAAYFLFVSGLKKLRKRGSGADRLQHLLDAAESERRSKSHRTLRANSEAE